jgi:hypothetical protein
MARAGDVLQRLKTRFSDARLHTRNAQSCIEQERHWHTYDCAQKPGCMDVQQGSSTVRYQIWDMVLNPTSTAVTSRNMHGRLPKNL